MRFSETLFFDRHRSCGVELIPLTLGHACLLQRMGNPWSVPGADDAVLCQLDAVTMCALVCSRQWRKAARIVNSRRGALWLRWTAWWRKDLLLADYIGMSKWFRAQWQAPATHVEGEKSDRKRGADFLGMLSVAAQTHLGVQADRVMDHEIARLQYELLTFGEQNGTLRIMTGKEPTYEDLMKAGKEFEERLAKRKATA